MHFCTIYTESQLDSFTYNVTEVCTEIKSIVLVFSVGRDTYSQIYAFD